MLQSLSGHPLFVGETIGSACTVDSGILSFYYGATLAFLQGAALCEAESVSLATYISALIPWLPVVAETVRMSGEMIDKGSYSAGSEAAVAIHAAALGHVRQLGQESGVDGTYTECMLGYLTKAVAAGHGQDELPVVFEFFRRKADGAKTE